MDSAITIARGKPVGTEEAVDLYRVIGWTAYADNSQMLRAALDGSSCVVTARESSELVGLARVVSDNASIAYLQDVLVHPGRRRLGIGRQLVAAALEPFAHVRQKVLLTDDEPGQRAFYEGLGYTEAGARRGAPLRCFVRFDS